MTFIRTLARTTLFAALCMLTSAAAYAGGVDKITISFDHEDALYKVGEEATFTISALDASGAPADSGVLTIRGTNDGRDVLGTATVDLASEQPSTYTYGLSKPGFVKVFVDWKSADGSEKKDALAGVGFEPEKIKPGQPKPDDFDEFWAAGKAEVRAIPIDVQQRKLEEQSNENRDMYAISFATVNNQRVTGYLGIPKTGKAPYPALVNVAFAGTGFGPDMAATDEGFVTFTLNVFPYEVPIDETVRNETYKAFNDQLGCAYFEYNMRDRDNYFYRAPILGLDRAIDWFAEQEYVDPERIGYHGTSQGGGMGLILTGLNKHIKRAMFSVPAMCDPSGYLEGRNSGWPQLPYNWRNKTEEEITQTREALRYYDAANFAQSIDIPATVTVGFIDVTCCPSSVYATYNSIPSKHKQIKNGIGVWHTNDTNYWSTLRDMKAVLKGAKCPLEGNWTYDLEFSDEFNGDFDWNKWHKTNPTWLGRQPGFFSADNVTVEGGALKLTARNESKGDPNQGYKDFTTAAVKSKNRVRYGYFEVRSKSMNSIASSSFWFYADDPDRWTEIDVYETSGAHPEHGNKYHMNLHVMKSPETGDEHYSDAKTWEAPFRFADDFHRYGFLWTPEKLCWYVDDQLVRESENKYWTQELYVNFDSETMPEWFGLPDPQELPATFEIDYIRHWVVED